MYNRDKIENLFDVRKSHSFVCRKKSIPSNLFMDIIIIDLLIWIIIINL